VKIAAKAKKRLLILAAVTLCVVFAAGGFVAFRKHRLAVTVARLREDGLRADRSGNYPLAVDKLKLYLTYHPDDREALIAYVDARPQVESESFQHIIDTVRSLRYLLQLDPSLVEQRRTLLGYYQLMGLRSETIETADLVLKAQPNDAKALDAKTMALIELKKYQEALDATEQWAKFDPMNLVAQVRKLSLFAQLGRPAAYLLNVVNDWAKAHPGEEARSQLLRACAYADAGDRENCQVWLHKAAAQHPPDDTFSTILVGQFATWGAAGEDVGVLEDLVKKGAGRVMSRILLCRYWEQGRYKEAVDLGQKIDVHDSSVPVNVVALMALAYEGLGKHAEAVKLRDIISSRPDPFAKAWTGVLDARGNSVATWRTLEARCAEALHHGDNVYIRYFLAESFANLGEIDLALENFRLVARTDQTWPTPVSRMAELLLQKGNLDQGAQAAVFAFHRHFSPSTALILARVSVALDQVGRPTGNSQQILDEVEKVLPGNDDVELLRLQCLTKTASKEGLGGRIRSVLYSTLLINLPLPSFVSFSRPPSEPFLLRMASISRTQKLGLEAEILDTDQRLHGTSPQLALARALDESNAGRPADGLKAFDSAQQDAKADTLEWQFARVQYLTLSKDPGAKDAWKLLAARYPTDLRVQQAALTAPPVSHERAFLLETLQRLRAILGEQSLVCSLAQAHILSDNRADDSDDREIAEILKPVIAAHPGMSEPRILWARNLERTGKVDDAIQQLQVAASLTPESSALAFELASLFRRKGDYDKAEQELDRVAGSKSSTPADLETTAQMLAQQGDYARAASLLKDLPSQDNDDLVLAELYFRRNQFEMAEPLLARLLGEPRPDVNVIKFAARFYQSRGNADGAQKAIGRLEKLGLNERDKSLARGDVFASIGRTEDALKQYHQAIASAPKDPNAWRALIACLYMNNRSQEAGAANDKALQLAGADPSLTQIKQAAPALQTCALLPEMRSMMFDYLHSPADNPAALDAMTVIARASVSADSAAVVAQAKMLSQRYPRFEGVQLWAIRTYIWFRRFNDAAPALTRAMQVFPDSEEIAAMATTFYGTQKRWVDMLEAAREWRKRTGNQLAPDTAIAKALTARGRPQEAVAQLQPYLAECKAAPDQHIDALLAYADALRGVNGADAAAAEVLPLAADAAKLRGALMVFVAIKLNANDGTAWLQHLATSVDSKSSDQLVELANAWVGLASRFPDNKPFQDEASRLFEQITSRGDANAGALEAAGMFTEEFGDKAMAMTLYRRALALEPRRPVTNNNLASAILATGGDLDEAAKYAGVALKENPYEPEFLDTLSALKVKARDYKAAAQYLQQAVDLDSLEPRWRVELAQLFWDNGQRADAIRALSAMDEAGINPNQLSDPLRKQLDRLRTALNPPPGAHASAAPAAAP